MVPTVHTAPTEACVPRSVASTRETRGGFSLVEVSLATAISSFALLVIFGLVVPGLNVFRGAIDTTVTAQIAQRIITDAEQTDFDLLLAEGENTGAQFFNLPVRYFDEQGTELLPTAANAEADSLYQVLVRGSLPGPRDVGSAGSGFTSLPGKAGEARFEPRDSVFLTVQVARKGGMAPLDKGEHSLWKTQQTVPISTFRSVLTRNGYNVKKTL